MWLTLLYSFTGGAAVLYALYQWVIPTVAQYHAGLALFWNDFIVERIRDAVTQSTRPQGYGCEVTICRDILKRWEQNSSLCQNEVMGRPIMRILAAVQKMATRGDPQSVVNAIDNFCRTKEWAMNVGDEKGAILDSVVSEVNPTTVLELGTYCGYSTVRIASLLPPGGRLLTLELNPDYAAIARQVISFAGLEEKVHLIEGASGDWIPKIKEHFGVKTLDLVFLDHWKDRYLIDTKLMEECDLLREGSVLLADNVICPGTPDYLEYVRNSPRYESRYFKSHLEYTKVEDGLEKSVFLG